VGGADATTHARARAGGGRGHLPHLRRRRERDRVARGHQALHGRDTRINPAILADIAQAQIRLDRMARRVPLEAPWEADRAARWDAQTFATWLRHNVATVGGRTLFEIGVEAVW